MTFGRGAGAIISAMAAAVRRPLRELLAIAIKFQYLIYPYANFHVGPQSSPSLTGDSRAGSMRYTCQICA
jgi:hypothetical protein